ncbi:hypothetical protein K9U39_00830 [Rhodoblastus acidophilus]|uniref:Type II secretion system protein GspC N-terminal domain-containing protein n=1 Tax=Candidatus Rhodoblastus alkanivorans TaxID=2954117 RepID=A0ABS9Z4T8_9HYPH|nr:hypothetical protein [Candidatus Rhodoblastus alkanivorans]MCI4678813.1 hypothetical protein [Candidatus Rhodoblastus alkanivorans]MCI4682202.1 hypothetical protein [Candidatus Rhodoblastus alkanivorans]MDI4639504.1 hypothetical protein [Rhodoblastus acidophilus]
MNDLALKSVGLACAAGSVWFAVFMFNHQEGGPRIYAMKDFAIFAQPNRVKAVEAAVRAAAAEDRTRKAHRSITIDMTPVGAVPARSEAKDPPERHKVRIVELNDDNALLESDSGFRRVRVGDESPEIGRIIAIRSMGDYWVVVASQRSLAQVAPEIGPDSAGGEVERP